MNSIEKRPLLSLCLSGRNDNYGFNFKRRFVQAMNFLAWSARRAGVEKQIEVVFADWNSEIPLSRTIRLSDGAAKMVRFLEIPPDLAARYNPSFSPFSQSVAFNAALRRAKGAYLGMMPADILLTSYALRNLIGILSGTIPVPFDPRSAVISVPRKNIPFYAVHSLSAAQKKGRRQFHEKSKIPFAVRIFPASKILKRRFRGDRPRQSQAFNGQQYRGALPFSPFSVFNTLYYKRLEDHPQPYRLSSGRDRPLSDFLLSLPEGPRFRKKKRCSLCFI